VYYLSRILIRAGKLFDGYSLKENIELSVEDGIVYYGRRQGSYDRRIEASTVLPGLIDTHVHLVHDTRPGLFSVSARNVINLFLAHGVISVRDTGNYLSIRDLFNSFNQDFEVILTYTVEKPPLSWMFMRMINNINDLDLAVERAYVEGCKWFKLYNNVTPDIAREAVVKAHGKGLKITCHVTGIGMYNVINYGFDAVEHFVSLPFVEPISSDHNGSSDRVLEKWESIDEGVLEDIAKKMSEKRVAITTTLALIRSMIGKLRIDRRKYSKYIMPWYRFFKFKKKKEYDKVYSKILKAIRILWENKVIILGGTDLPNSALNPGISLWEELDILIEAGLTIWDALKTVTGYAHEAIGSGYGVIRESGKANLLIINGDIKSVDDLVIDEVIIGNNSYKPNDLLNQLKKIPWFGF